MTKPSKSDVSKPEVHSDAWERFERAVDVVAKSPPQHRVGQATKAPPKKRKSAKVVKT